MKRTLQTLIALFVLTVASPEGLCASSDMAQEPWEQFSLNAGIFISSIDSSFRLGSGIGVSIEPEELLGLDTTQRVFRIDGSWRFSENRKHRLDLTWFTFRRSGSSVLDDDIILEDPETGESVEIPAGSEINGNLDLDIFDAPGVFLWQEG